MLKHFPRSSRLLTVPLSSRTHSSSKSSSKHSSKPKSKPNSKSSSKSTSSKSSSKSQTISDSGTEYTDSSNGSYSYTQSEPLIYYVNDPAHSNPGYSSSYTNALTYTYGFPQEGPARTELEQEIVAESQSRVQGNIDGYDQQTGSYGQ